MTGVRITRLLRPAGAAALAVLAGACQSVMPGPDATATVTTAPSKAALVAPARPLDAEASREDARVVAQYGGRFSDPAVEATVNAVVARLVAASDTPDRGFRVTLLNSPVANAFALPGGSLYVTRGLIALADDESELAAVLSHEMAHVIASHALERARAAEQVALVEGVATDVLSDAREGAAALSTSKMSLAKFSREQEVDADRIGIRIAAKAGFDPYAASRFIEKLERYAAFRSALGVKEGANFLASHPAALERRSLATSAAAQVAPAAGAASGRDAFLSTLDGLIYGDDPSEGFVRGREYLHPRLAIGFRVPERYRVENGKDAVLAAADRDTAMRFDAVTVAAGTTPAAYLASGWVNGLDAASIAATKINGLSGATASATAGAWRFRIGVVKIGNGMFRLIFADRDDPDSIARDLTETLGTFHRLSAAERARLRPLRLDVVAVGAGDTVASLAARMRGTDRGRDLFLLLNGVSPDAPLTPGRRVKIVVD